MLQHKVTCHGNYEENQTVIFDKIKQKHNLYLMYYRLKHEPLQAKEES